MVSPGPSSSSPPARSALDAPRDDKAYLGVKVAHHFAAGGAAGLQRAQHHRHVARVARGVAARSKAGSGRPEDQWALCAGRPAAARKAALSGVVAGFAAASGRNRNCSSGSQAETSSACAMARSASRDGFLMPRSSWERKLTVYPVFFTELAQSEVFPAPQLADGFQHNMHLVSLILYGMRRRFASPRFCIQKQKEYLYTYFLLTGRSRRFIIWFNFQLKTSAYGRNRVGPGAGKKKLVKEFSI